MSAAKPILIVGATGRHGGTGTTVARTLLARGVPSLCNRAGAQPRYRPLRSR
jgi:hypothetical protein